MEKENLETPEDNGKVSQVEDRVLKTAAQFFGEDLLPYLGIKAKIDRVAPTEHIHLEMRRLEEDFNFIMKDGSLRHLEFESDGITKEDLRRFREYESYLGMMFNMPVITTVLCTSKTRICHTELVNGRNVYRVELVQLKDRDAVKVFQKLERKLIKGKKLKRHDVFPLLISPLMSGKMEIGERICRGMDILQSNDLDMGEYEIKRMQSVLYALATKFLKKNELEQVKERIGMTLLGQMLWDMGVENGWERGKEKGLKMGFKQGIEQGIEKGIQQGFEQGIEQGMQKGVEQGIQAMILDGLEDGIPKERIINKLSLRFSIGKGEALSFYKKYAPENT